MPHELQKEIENHLATFPERHNDLIEMRKEWGEFKNRSFWILIGFISSILLIGVWVGTIQTNIENINEVQAKADLKRDQAEKRIGSLEVSGAEILTRLTSIDLALQEIKYNVRQLPK